MAMESKDQSENILNSVKVIEPEQLWAIEIFFAGNWCSAIIKGVIVVAAGQDAANRIKIQIATVHLNSNRPCPPLRIRLLSKKETEEVRSNLKRHGQVDAGKFGTDLRRREQALTPKDLLIVKKGVSRVVPRASIISRNIRRKS